MKTWDRATICPYCDAHMDASSGILDSRREPGQGDLSFCFDCGEWCVFDLRLIGALRKPVWEEHLHIATTPKLMMVREAWLMWKEMQRAKSN